MRKLIVSLFDFSGVWSGPYADRPEEYEVIQLDIKSGGDVRGWNPPRPPYGVLAAPPCTMFTNAGALYWSKRTAEELSEAVRLVARALLVAGQSTRFWALENPAGRLSSFIGPHVYEFQPNHFVDTWTKRTYLWGNFSPPKRRPVAYTHGLVSDTRSTARQAAAGDTLWGPHVIGGLDRGICGSGGKRQAFRSQTPPGFARAFFEANR